MQKIDIRDRTIGIVIAIIDNDILKSAIVFQIKSWSTLLAALLRRPKGCTLNSMGNPFGITKTITGNPSYGMSM